MGPLSGANECFLMVLTEYLTKWAEVYPIPNKQKYDVFLDPGVQYRWMYRFNDVQ